MTTRLIPQVIQLWRYSVTSYILPPNRVGINYSTNATSSSANIGPTLGVTFWKNYHSFWIDIVRTEQAVWGNAIENIARCFIPANQVSTFSSIHFCSMPPNHGLTPMGMWPPFTTSMIPPGLAKTVISLIEAPGPTRGFSLDPDKSQFLRAPGVS